MSLSRKRKKELRRLQDQANKLWDSQQVLVGEAASVAREAGRQLGNYNREHITPTVQANYEKYAAPYVDKGVKTAQQVFGDKVVPAAGAVVGSAMSVWDVANDTRSKLASGRGLSSIDLDALGKKTQKNSKKATKKISARLAAASKPASQKSGMGAGGVIALLLGIAAAVGVVYAAWQTLRADDELWVADDPLRAPDA
ncbi:DNA helicase [Microbacterium horticulturae]|uniref:DNA helicase n=1 Tax=Microbacterium horticulturae TaxID=3028316 RepID=A0ABY8BXQ2_9MICO|nr:DNA helicase [Microbacterium sp. KACC 23027]WEG08979.1 DNA helicase [Microbacterium sp. KACC 23027]